MAELKIKEISYERVHNLGNYETERMGVSGCGQFLRGSKKSI